MKQGPLYFASIVSILLTGCATTPYVPVSDALYQKKFLEWKNKDINDLIYAWGPPSSTFTMPNTNKMFTWDNMETGSTVTSTQGSSVYLGHGVAVGDGQSVSHTETWECHTTIVTSASGTILSWQFKGNNCGLAYSDQEYAQKLSFNRSLCQTLTANTPILLRFFTNAREVHGDPLGASVQWFFMGYDHDWEEVLIAKKKRTGFVSPKIDGYPVKYIEDITVAAEDAK